MASWSNKPWLKSRKARVFFAVFTLLIIAGLALIFASSGDQAAKPDYDKNAEKLALRQKQESQELNKDSDRDGLKDWEERIYRTDSYNPDTDGDRTPDGEEIKQGRDPLKPGPDDYLATSTPIQTEAAISFSPENLTGRLVQSFTQNFAIPRVANPSLPIDNESVSYQALQDALPYNPPVGISFFTIQDITISDDNSRLAFEKYTIQTVDALTPFQGLDRLPLEIFSEAVQKEDLSLLKSLDPYLVAYDKTLANLKKIKTPSRFAPFYVRYLNKVLEQKNAVQKMRDAEKDLVSGAVGAQQYVNTSNELRDMGNEFLNIFRTSAQ